MPKPVHVPVTETRIGATPWNRPENPMTHEAIRIFIADDHALFRGGLVALLAEEPDLEIVGETGEGRGLDTLIEQTSPQVLILDISMPGPPVGDMITHLASRFEHLHVVVLTMHEEEFYLREALAAGAAGFVLKRSTGSELVSAVRAVVGGRTYVDPSLSHMLVSDWIGRTERGPSKKLLSRREEEVLRHLALGNTNREIAEQLNISKRTVETHRANIMKKLGARSRSELVSYAMGKGLLPPAGEA